MPKKPAPAALVRRALDEVEPPKRALPARSEEAIPFVIPSVAAMLQDIRIIVGTELSTMKEAKTMVGDATGQKIRNLAATIASVLESEKKLDDNDMSDMTPEQLAAAHEEAARRLRGEMDE